MNELRPYKKRGFGRVGARCPTCGGPPSHGRDGNPAWRTGQPLCTKPTALVQRAANGDARGRMERIRAKHEEGERIARLEAANRTRSAIQVDQCDVARGILTLSNG